MKLKLNIYDNKDQVVKTYTAEDFRLKTRTIRKLTEVIDLEKITGATNNVELATQVGKIVVTSFDEIGLILKQVFDGLTDEELDNTNIDEIVDILMTAGKYTLTKLFGIKFEKN